MAEVRFENVHKRFGEIAAVDELNLTVDDGEFLVFVGPSGCGKTTSLRMLAGLETVTRGEIWVDGRRMTHVPPRERDMAMVFQNYALYPHMNVRDNIGFSLGLKRVGKDQIAARVQRAAELVRIEKYLDRLPKELSGGQRQRVAVCRAIVRDPKVFLFDEPLSNLDPQLRSSARAEIRSLQRRLGTTSIYVTHDQVEALTMADRIVVMNEARVQQIGTPEEIFETPANTFVASFIGAPPMNLVTASRRGDALVALGRRIEARGTTSDVVLGIRAESIDLTDGGPSSLRVSFVETIGTECLIHGEVDATPIVVKAERRAAPKPGSTVGIDWPVDETHFFDARTGARVPGAHRIGQ